MGMDETLKALLAIGPGEHTGLPVAGYRPQDAAAIDLVNDNKRLEEEVLRALDSLANSPAVDQRWLAVGRTHIEVAFMSINRAIFKPRRIDLPGDGSGDGT
jgi:hypothetical protein